MKKIKTNFNVLREMYLNDNNRDILGDVLKYLRSESRYFISTSFTDDTIDKCSNCFSCIDYKVKKWFVCFEPITLLCHACENEIFSNESRSFFEK